jgi:hypothetical protein
LDISIDQIDVTDRNGCREKLATADANLPLIALRPFAI